MQYDSKLRKNSSLAVADSIVRKIPEKYKFTEKYNVILFFDIQSCKVAEYLCDQHHSRISFCPSLAIHDNSSVRHRIRRYHLHRFQADIGNRQLEMLSWVPSMTGKLRIELGAFMVQKRHRNYCVIAEKVINSEWDY